jgi:hypothetical protein
MDRGVSYYLPWLWLYRGEIGRMRLTICAKAEAEVEPIMPAALPAPLIEYIKCDR